MIDPRVRLLAGVDPAVEGAQVVRALDGPTIRIFSPSGPVEWRHQVVLLTLVDLLGRLFPRLDVDVELGIPASPLLPPGGSDLGQRVSEVRQRSPLRPLQPAEPAITVQIGPGQGIADVHVDAAGWQSYLGREPSRLPSVGDSAIGPVVAACRAGAHVYDLLLAEFRDPLPMMNEMYASALTYRHAHDPLDDPAVGPSGRLDALLVGVGSVGGAAVYAFAFQHTLEGQLMMCDPQRVEELNPYRAVLATAAAATRQDNKVDDAKDALAHHPDLTVIPISRMISDWEADQPGPPALPLTLVAVDTRQAREEIQDALPLDVVNAAVGDDVLAISGHRTGDGPCMCCLHLPDVLDGKRIKNRLIADCTGIDAKVVNVLRIRHHKLDKSTLATIEKHRRMVPGSLQHFEGRLLDELYEHELVYGEAAVQTQSGGHLAVASPFVTALAGALLAGEAIKHSTATMAQFALGVFGTATRYRENPYASAENAHLDGHISREALCLCRSVRRLRATAARYDIPVGILGA